MRGKGSVKGPVIRRAFRSTRKQLSIDTKINKENLPTMSLFTCADDS